MFHLLKKLGIHSKQYTAVWCIVFSFIVVPVVSAFSDATTFTLFVEYGLTGDLSVIGPSGIVIKGPDTYFSGELYGFVSVTSPANVSVSSSRSELVYEGVTDSSGFNFSYTHTGDDGPLFWTGNALGFIDSSRYEYYPISLFKDSTPPSHSGMWSYIGDNIASPFQISWSSAIDTGVIDFYYSYEMIGIGGIASGYILSTSTTSNTLSFGPGLFFPGDYNIVIKAIDSLGNTSEYSSLFLSLNDDSPIDTNQASGGGGGYGGHFDVCLCGDYSGVFNDYRCSASGEQESNYVFQYCSGIYSDFSGGTIPDDFVDQWSVITESFLFMIGSLPTAFNTILELPTKQLIIGDQQDAYWNKMQIVMQKNYTGDTVIFDIPYIQGTLQDGILYITYIDKPLNENVLCLNCCSTMYTFFPSMSFKKLFWYLWWCNPIVILFLLLCVLLLLLLIFRRFNLFYYAKTLKSQKKS